MSARVIKVERAMLEGRRPRGVGCNARLGDHGDRTRLPIIRLTDSDGATGFGASWATEEQAERLAGARLDEAFSPQAGTAESWRAFDFPLWDLMSRRAGQPVHALAAAMIGQEPPAGPLRAPCYDTSLYFDDLHLATTEEAAELIAAEARAGFARGHRAFKIKVGRGARHMPPAEGTARDIAVVRAVRAAVGPQAALMLDANNGYTLNLAKRVLEETADCGVFWLEEAFHEDAVLYRDLKDWLARRNLPVLIADGEGEASAHLLDWARQGLIDVIQYDIYGHGFTGWLRTGRQLDAWGVRSAPHHFGGHYGNYAACHLAGALRHFAFVEWDETATPGLDGSGYVLADGLVSAPAAPGFGLALDEEAFQRAVAETLTNSKPRHNG